MQIIQSRALKDPFLVISPIFGSRIDSALVAGVEDSPSCKVGKDKGVIAKCSEFPSLIVSPVYVPRISFSCLAWVENLVGCNVNESGPVLSL